MLRPIQTLAIIILSASAALRAHAQVPEDAKAILEKAIKASGGKETRDKFRGMTWNETGKYYGMGDGLDYTGKYAIEWPDKFKMEISGAFTIVYNKDKGWVGSPNSGVNEMPADDLAEQQKAQRASHLAAHLPLTEKDLKWTTVGETKINDRPALGVKASQPGQRDITMYFDKETGLLTKSEFIVKSREHDNKEVNQEVTYSDYKDVQGVKNPTKFSIKRDGKIFVEGERSEMKMVEKFDDSTFAKPQ
jgi:outer membrane lipoprotein-sorting protein